MVGLLKILYGLWSEGVKKLDAVCIGMIPWFVSQIKLMNLSTKILRFRCVKNLIR